MMDEEKLIELVREHRVLFDPKEKKYMDNRLKNAIWKDIAAQCGLSSGDCAKETWKKLRDGYRCSIKRKRNPRSGSAESSSHTWKYDELMSFIRPFMKNRSSTKNEFASTSDDAGSGEKEPAIVSVNCNMESETEEVESTPALPVRHSSYLKIKANPVLQFLEKETRKKEERSSEREELRRRPHTEDGLKLFFDSMYEATRYLPNHLQRKIKRGLFNLVSDGEEEAEAWSDRSHYVDIEVPVNNCLDSPNGFSGDRSSAIGQLDHSSVIGHRSISSVIGQSSVNSTTDPLRGEAMCENQEKYHSQSRRRQKSPLKEQHLSSEMVRER